MFAEYIGYIKVLLPIVILGIGIFYVLYLASRARPNAVSEIFKEIIKKRGGWIAGGRYFGYPEYHLSYQDIKLNITFIDPFASETKSNYTYVFLNLPKYSKYRLTVTGSVKNVLFKKIAAKITFAGKILPLQGVLEEFSNKLMVRGDNLDFAQHLITEDMQQKMIYFYDNYTYFRFHDFSMYIEGRNMVLSAPGIIKSMQDAELLLDLAIALYERMKDFGKDVFLSESSLTCEMRGQKKMPFWKGMLIGLSALAFAFFSLYMALFDFLPNKFKISFGDISRQVFERLYNIASLILSVLVIWFCWKQLKKRRR